VKSRGASIQVLGLDEVMRELDRFDPEARKAIAAGITKVPKEVAAKTRGKVKDPALRNWGGWSRSGGKNKSGGTSYADVGALRWDKGAVRSGIRSLSGGKRMNVTLVNKSAAGAVFEMAGSDNPNRPFNRAMNRYGPAPRLLVKTWREEKGIKRTASAVGREMRKAEDKLRRVGGS
jgi:hypothetical protein